MNKNVYKYKDAPLTPSICEELILEFYDGQLEMRHNLTSGVLELHLKKGGKKPKAIHIDRIIKRALETLRKKGYAENPFYGHWRISSLKKFEKIDLKKIPSTLNNEIDCTCEIVHMDEESKHNNDINRKNDTIILGKGNESIYVYYLPIYKELAKNEGKNSWPCKIGRTDGDPLQRIISQSSTALPEKPKIALIIKSHNSRTLENIIHSTLLYRNKRISSALGKEWFDTNPDEIVKIVQFIEQSSMLCE